MTLITQPPKDPATAQAATSDVPASTAATASLPPHPCHRISATASCLLRSAEENALLREQLAAKDKQNADQAKQIAELMAQLSLAKSGHRIIGIWTSLDERRVAEVYEGPQGGTYYYSETGNRMTLNDDKRIEFMSEEDVKKRDLPCTTRRSQRTSRSSACTPAWTRRRCALSSWAPRAAPTSSPRRPGPW